MFYSNVINLFKSHNKNNELNVKNNELNEAKIIMII